MRRICMRRSCMRPSAQPHHSTISCPPPIRVRPQPSGRNLQPRTRVPTPEAPSTCPSPAAIRPHTHTPQGRPRDWTRRPAALLRSGPGAAAHTRLPGLAHGAGLSEALRARGRVLGVLRLGVVSCSRPYEWSKGCVVCSIGVLKESTRLVVMECQCVCMRACGRAGVRACVPVRVCVCMCGRVCLSRQAWYGRARDVQQAAESGFLLAGPSPGRIDAGMTKPGAFGLRRRGMWVIASKVRGLVKHGVCRVRVW